MTKLKIKTQSLPTRCEICHQMDMFEPEQGICQRCQDVPAQILILPNTDMTLSQWANLRFHLLVNLIAIRINLITRLLQLNVSYNFVRVAFLIVTGLVVVMGTVAFFSIDINPKISVRAIESQTTLPPVKNDNLAVPNRSVRAEPVDTTYVPDRYGIFSSKNSGNKKVSGDRSDSRVPPNKVTDTE
ncbi:MAG: hypothetical protein AB1489_26865 [Acidobacteriota bacterium]